MMPRTNQTVLFLITKSNFGGAQKYVYELATAVQAAGGHPVVALGGTGESTATTGELATRLRAAEIEVRIVHNFMRNMSPLKDIKAAIEVGRIIRAIKPDVLHVTSSKAGGIGTLMGRLARVPKIIFTSHGLTYDETWRPRWQRFLIAGFTWLTIMLSHYSVMISRETYARARSLPFTHNRVRLIYNGLRPPNFLPRAEARATLVPEATTDELWIGGIGELHPNKNWPLIITAFAQAGLPHSRLMIIGDGSEEAALKQQIAELACPQPIHIIARNPAAELILAFDIFVLASRKEGLPYVLLEAGAAGRAVLGSDIAGNRDIIESSTSGELVPATAEHFAHALTALADRPDRRETYGRALETRVRTRFTIEHMITDTLQLYQS